MHIHHIGYLVKDIDRATQSFLAMGYSRSSETVDDGHRNVRICFLGKDGYLVELISPMNQDSDVYHLLKKHGNTPYHICYEVENLEESLKEFCATNACAVIQAPCAAVAIENRNVAFVMHRHLGIIEFVEAS